MKMSKFEKVFVNMSARSRNIKVIEYNFDQIETNNVKKVLEVGCGAGMLSSYIADKYRWKVTGIDIDPKQIERAKEDHKENNNLKFIEADVTKLTIGDKEFDLILSFDALHHIPKLDKALNEISRVLKPDGFYIFNDLIFPKWLTLNNWVIPIDRMKDDLKRNNIEIIYEKKRGIRVSVIFQKS